MGEMKEMNLDRERCSGCEMLELCSGPLGRKIEWLCLLTFESGSGRGPFRILSGRHHCTLKLVRTQQRVGMAHSPDVAVERGFRLRFTFHLVMSVSMVLFGREEAI